MNETADRLLGRMLNLSLDPRDWPAAARKPFVLAFPLVAPLWLLAWLVWPLLVMGLAALYLAAAAPAHALGRVWRGERQ